MRQGYGGATLLHLLVPFDRLATIKRGCAETIEGCIGLGHGGMSFVIHHGDALSVLRTMPDESAHCCVTSPPYYGLRDYGTGKWSGGDVSCDHKKVSDVAGAVATSTLGGGKKTTGHLQEGFGSLCGKCGAQREDQQIGLERTPEEFITRLVQVFREVRRVLRSDATLWVNIGDSYNAAGRDGHGTRIGFKQGTNRASACASDTFRPTDLALKPKDLCMIPARLAIALQQPYYTGRINRLEDRVWLAAMIDAEGCLFIHKRKAGQNNGQGYFRQNDNYGPGLEVANTSESVVNRCMEIVGLGSICSQTPDQNNRRKQTILRWNLRTTECRDVIREIYPYLVAKQQQARILCGCPSSGESAKAAHAALIGLHNGTSTDVDFPAPDSMLEQGFYLRSDVIWAKSNPMPESVTDRPTKAHEYLFLLAKGERYYYDSNAIKEKSSGLSGGNFSSKSHDARRAVQSGGLFVDRRPQDDGTRNKRSVWTISTLPTPDAHFATFPIELPETCIRAGCPVDGVVLDPFAGAGTTGLAAIKNGRNFVGIELNAEYIQIAHNRAMRHYPLLMSGAAV